MIELIVQDYCQECPEFTPETSSTITRSWDGNEMALNTSVFCRYAYRCREIAKRFGGDKHGTD